MISRNLRDSLIRRRPGGREDGVEFFLPEPPIRRGLLAASVAAKDLVLQPLLAVLVGESEAAASSPADLEVDMLGAGVDALALGLSLVEIAGQGVGSAPRVYGPEGGIPVDAPVDPAAVAVGGNHRGGWEESKEDSADLHVDGGFVGKR